MFLARGLSFCNRSCATWAAQSKYPQSADVVVVGGGVIGLSTAYHLAKHGGQRVAVLERSKITSGTTWHTAGLIWSLRPSDTDIQLLNRTRHVLTKELPACEGVEDTGFINNGGLFLAHSQQRLSEYRRLDGIAKAFGIESHILDRRGLTDLLGGLLEGENSGLVGGLYSPSDGYVDPSSYCNALRKASGPNCKVFEGCEVLSIKTAATDSLVGGQQDKVTSVAFKAEGSDDVHEIKTDVVVSASGAWADNVASMAGIGAVAQEVFEHSYVITQPIPGLVDPKKTPNIRDHDMSMYFRVTGQSFKIGGYEPHPMFIQCKSKDLGPFSLFDLNWNVFGVNVENGMKVMPIIEKVGIQTSICGPESFTPDHKPLVGEDPAVRGYFHSTGFNSFGMNLSGGIGDQLAKWIVRGEPELDLFTYDVRRFPAHLVKDRKWVKERSLESYAKNYSIVFPYDEYLSGRDGTFRDGIYDRLKARGAVYQEREGRERPGWFDLSPTAGSLSYPEYLGLDYSFDWTPDSRQWSAIRNECLSCRNNVAVFNTSYMGKISVNGAQAEEALEYLCTSDLKSKAEGSTVYTCFLNSNGGVEADLTVSKIDSQTYYLTCSGFQTNYALHHMHRVLRDQKSIKKVTLKDVTKEFGIISVQGPNSRKLLEAALDMDGLDVGQFAFSTHRLYDLKGYPQVKVRAIRLTFVGELGWELHVPSEHLAFVYDLLMGERGPRMGAVDGGWRAVDSLSAEKGYRHWHEDLRPDDTPFEAGIGFTVNKDRLQRETFFGARSLQQRRQQPAKKLLCVTLDDPNQVVWGLEPMLVANKPVGFIRRGSYGFHLNKSIGYGYVSAQVAAESPGNVGILINGKVREASVHKKHPFDPQNMRVKGIYES